MTAADHAPISAASSQDHPGVAPAPFRSAITNGALLPGVDGRSAWSRRARDLMQLHTADMGGADRLSQAELSLVRRAVVITVQLEQLEQAFATAPAVDPDMLDLYGRTAGSLRRILEPLGLKRVQRDVTPSLDAYLKARGDGP